MLDPSSTKVLGRRIGAGLIDFLTVSLLAAYFADTQSEEFAIVDRTAEGDPIWTATEFDRIQSYADGFNRAQEWGDTLHVFDVVDVLLILLVTTLLSLLAKVLIPANTGWSLGQRIFGIKVIDGTGDNPSVAGHLARMWPAIVDVLPGFLPGLVGWIIASRSVHTQRIGDKVANTYVVSRKSEPRMLKPSSRGTAEPETPTTASPPPPSREVSVSADTPVPAGKVDDPPAPTLENVGTGLRGAAEAKTPSTNPATVATTAAAGATGGVIASGLADKFSRAQSASAAKSIDGLNVDGSKIKDLSADLPSGPDPDEPSPLSPPTAETPSLGTSLFATPSPETTLAEPPAVEPSVVEPVDPSAPAFDAPETSLPAMDASGPADGLDTVRPEPARSMFNEAPESVPQEPGQPADTGGSSKPPPPAHRSAAQRQQLVEGASASELIEPEPTDAPPPRHRVERSNWDQPVAEAAPVWSPVNPQATQAPVDTQPATISTAPEAATDPQATVLDTAETHAVPADQSLEPQWNEEWGAWMFWDQAQECWLRHDTDNDVWLRVE